MKTVSGNTTCAAGLANVTDLHNFVFSGGGFNAGDSSCMVSVVVTSTTPGSYTNTQDAIRSPSNILVGTFSTTLNVNALPNLSIDDVSHNEGNRGGTTYRFTVSLSSPAPTGGVTNATTTDGQGQGTITNDDMPPPPVTLTPASLPGGKAGMTYSQTLHAGGSIAPYSYSLSGGSLPTGLNLNGAVIGGTPIATGSVSFSITANDSIGGGGAHSATVNYTIVIAAPTITVGPTKLNAGKVGADFNQTVAAVGGTAPYTWSVSGTLPPGLSLNTSSGAITGIPTASSLFTFTVTAKDSTAGGAYTGSVTYNAKIDPPSITLNLASLPTGKVGTAYNQTFTISGGTSPYTYTVNGALPAGLSLNASTGQLSGTPTAAGTFALSITAKDSTAGSGSPFSGSKVYKLVINP